MTFNKWFKNTKKRKAKNRNRPNDSPSGKKAKYKNFSSEKESQFRNNLFSTNKKLRNPSNCKILKEIIIEVVMVLVVIQVVKVQNSKKRTMLFS